MKIESFSGKNRFLSNFWPCAIRHEGLIYPSTEHAFQAAKTLVLADRKIVQNATTPGIAKRLGRELVIRPDWDTIRVDVMRALTMEKFLFHRALCYELLSTSDIPLVEGNTWHDNFWGVCWCDRCQITQEGHNNLGKILMEVRETLRAASYFHSTDM